MENREADAKGREGQMQSGPRGVLESDCAVMVPAAYAPGFHHNDLNVGVFRQNADLSEIIDDEILTTKDELAPNGSIMDRSDGFLYEEQPASSCRPIDFFTGGYYGTDLLESMFDLCLCLVWIRVTTA